MASAIMAFISLGLFGISSATLWWMVHAWRTPETLLATRFGESDGHNRLSFSLLVPARHEEQVLERTVVRLLESPYPDFEVIVIVGHDDPTTAVVAHRLARDLPERVTVVTDTHANKNKPKALNSALPHCRGDVVGVFDAEDQVHPELLTHVDHAFRSTSAVVVQGAVQLINFHSSWYSLRNCLEYFFWFRSRLHLHAQRGFIPLGGNTVFVRSRILRTLGGWDPQCLAEDCDLGVRLSAQGERIVVAYDPAMVTREETPDSLYGLFKQRTRWNQGFLQVYRKGDWRRLPAFRQRMLARWTLGSPFLQALSAVAIPVGLCVALFVELPALVALITFVPAIPLLATLAFEVAGLHEFGQEYGLRVRPWHYLKLVLGAPLYTLVLAAAALRAAWRESKGESDWELTRHVGAHLTEPGPQGAT